MPVCKPGNESSVAKPCNELPVRMASFLGRAVARGGWVVPWVGLDVRDALVVVGTYDDGSGFGTVDVVRIPAFECRGRDRAGAVG